LFAALIFDDFKKVTSSQDDNPSFACEFAGRDISSPCKFSLAPVFPGTCFSWHLFFLAPVFPSPVT
jgi:hypothetical protein